MKFNIQKGWKNLKKQITPRKLKQDFRSIVKHITLKDVIYLLILPFLWMVIMFLPINWKNQLVLSIYDLSWWQLLTHGFVHQTWSHFYHNLQGYILFTILVLFLSGLIKEKERFFKLIIVLSLCIPIISSLVQIKFYPKLLPQVLTSQGASGVVSGLLALLPFFWVLYFSTKLKTKLQNVYLLNVCLTYAGLLFVIIYYPIHKNYLMIAVVASLLALFGFVYKKNLQPILKHLLKESKRNIVKYFFLILIPIFFLLMPIVLFPRNIVNGNTLIDFFMHYTGLILGLIFSYLFLFYEDFKFCKR